MSILPARGRLLLLAVLTAGALSISLAPIAQAASCPTSDAQSTLQLLNTERAAFGLRPLRLDPRLSAGAEDYSCAMVDDHFFAHVSPDGDRLQDRVAATGWLQHRPGWALGETLGWGTGSLGTPASIVAAWMKSPPHRAIVLRKRYRVVGIGIASGTPFGAAGGATFTADFGGGRQLRPRQEGLLRR